ncbi:MAG: hydantoinase B/oxoprolinase family protein [Acidobacteriaceae bacterium]|nr:hydantoinase B/oxoprolinase family protein [Acidobacteriaceae bacterium]
MPRKPPPRRNPEAGAAPDPIGLELFRQLLVSIAEEMGILLRRTAFSANIKERRDYSCAVYDGDGETVAMGDHMPVHLGAMPLSVREAIAACRPGPGDIVILNDPFRGGTHLPDITAVAAVFVPGESRPAFYVANRAHHADVGGMSPGSMPLAREIYQEGIRIPPIKLVRGGAMDEPLLELLLANVRTPEERRGDLTAQLRSLERGAERCRELVARQGLAVVREQMAALQDYAERRMRRALAELPDGRYTFADQLDEDGTGSGPLAVRVAVTISGDRAHVDFTGTARQTAGSVNANYAIAVAATLYVFRCLMEGEVPYNAGLLRPITIEAPAGTLVNALAPAAMAAGNVETSQRITDVLLGALAQAAPERIPAASAGTMNNLSFGGTLPGSGRPFAYYETIAGGMGAGPRHAGWPATHTHMTNSWNTPVEAFEHQYPVRVTAYRRREGSGGAGRRRGGDGIVREFEFLTAAEVTILSDRRARGPYGLAGGDSGQPGRNLLNGRPLPAKCRFAVEAGDRVRIETPGGGGWGGGSAMIGEPPGS